MSTVPFNGSTSSTSDNVGLGGASRETLTLLNKVAHVLTLCMPGCLLSDPAAKTGTSAATAWRTEAFTMNARGKALSVSAQEKAFTATTHDVAASKEAWYVLSCQTDGSTFTITKGADQTIGTKVLPLGPDNEVIVAYAQVITDSGGIFDASTDDFSVSGHIATLNIYNAPYITLIGNAQGTVFTA